VALRGEIEYGGTLVAPWTSVAGYTHTHTHTGPRDGHGTSMGDNHDRHGPPWERNHDGQKQHHGRWHTERRKSQHSRFTGTAAGDTTGTHQNTVRFFFGKTYHTTETTVTIYTNTQKSRPHYGPKQNTQGHSYQNHTTTGEGEENAGRV